MKENIFRNKGILGIPEVFFMEEDEKKALAGLSEEQLDTLEFDERFFHRKYNRHGVEDICRAAFSWAKLSGELNSDTFFERLHMLMAIDSGWTAVYSDSINQLAKQIVQEAVDSVCYAVDYLAKRRCDHTDADAWWSFLDFDEGDYVAFLANKLREKYHAFEITHGDDKIVIFESPEKIPSIA